MPLRIRKEVLWAIAAGAFVVVLVTGSIAIVIVRRMIHRRQIARIFPVNEGRPRCHPRCHMSLTDEDVARIPGTRSALRNPIQTNRPSRGWTNLSSRENLPRPPLPTVKPEVSNTQGANPALSWPLSPRLKRSNATPLVKIRGSPLTPIEENSLRKSGKLPSANKMVRAEESLDVNTGGRENVKEIQPSSDLDVFTAVALKPKPLFHNAQRSISTPMISQSSNEPPKLSKAGVDLDIDARHKRGSCLPRSTSLCSQYSGMVPDRPIPPLPFNFSTSTRLERVRSPIESSSKWTSGNSLLSGDTYILDDAASRSTSQAETDLTSVSAFSPPMLGRNFLAQDILDESFPQEFQHPDGISDLSHPSNSRFNFKPEISRSFRTSLVHSLPRSASSGLSMSLLDHGASWNVSSSSLRTDRPSPRKPNLLVPGSADRKSIIRRGISPASPLKNNVLFESREDLKSKRASTSILQVVSGNESSPLHDKLEKRPSSIATSDPIQWDPTGSMQQLKSTVSTGQSKGHRRQIDSKIQNVGGSGICITDIDSFDPSECPLMKDEEKCTTASEYAVDRQAPLRPPSRATFDPQISHGLLSMSPRNSRGTTYSPTLSMVEFYNADVNSSAESTPTKGPVNKLSGSNPNRHKTIFSDQGTANWSLLAPTMKFSAEPDPILDPEIALPKPDSSQSSSISDGSFLFPLPPFNPPNRHRRPNSQVRGPRSPPPGRSPLRGISKPNTSPGVDLRKSIAAIRRRNSEAKDLDPDQQARYINIGFTDNPILKDEPETFRGFRPIVTVVESSKGVVASPRDMPHAIGGTEGWQTPERKAPLGWESPGGLYCPQGFLKERSEAE